jgi:heme oxygenase
MSFLFARLKSGTEQQHREIESLIDPMKNFSSLTAYKSHVQKSWRFYRCAEAGLAAVDWSAAGIDFAARRKLPLLERDLGALGIPPDPAPDEGEPSAPLDLDFALGCLYVAEGATLGGQVISRHLATLGIGPENGGLFFHGYGTRTGAMWKSFQVSAAGYCVTEDQVCQAVNGAKAAFLNFGRAMLREEGVAHES